MFFYVFDNGIIICKIKCILNKTVIYISSILQDWSSKFLEGEIFLSNSMPTLLHRRFGVHVWAATHVSVRPAVAYDIDCIFFS